ncbi:MAG TPA: hypothetical protein VHR66_01950 [Gemmataceae bacterium]|jgi:hypothetical protein|nr:hypothetical protein [Gemmataceae bacterium]
MSDKDPAPATDAEKKADTTAGPAKKSAAARMMIRGLGGPVASGGKKGKTQHATDASKPASKPTGGGSSRMPFRGATKGR